MSRIFVILISLILVSFGESQSIYPDFKNQNFKSETIPKGWYVLKKATGDLNSDGLNDMAIIFESNDSLNHHRCFVDSESRIPARSIVVYLQEKGEYVPVVQNNDLVARADEGGMLPNLEPELEIKNQELTIVFQYTRANTSYHFEYNGTDFELTKAYSGGVSSPGAGSTEFTSFDFIRKRIIHETGFVYSDTLEVDTIEMNITNNKTLNELKCMYNWEVADDFSI